MFIGFACLTVTDMCIHLDTSAVGAFGQCEIQIQLDQACPFELAAMEALARALATKSAAIGAAEINTLREIVSPILNNESPDRCVQQS